MFRNRLRWFYPLVFALSSGFAAPSEKWVKVTAPEFMVITPLAEKEALAWANEFAQFVAALQEFIPLNPKRLPRLTMVLFARERDFARFRPVRPDGSPLQIAGFFSRRGSWAVAGLTGGRIGDETRATLFHEGTHWFLSAFEVPNPVWLEEGLAEVFSTFTIRNNRTSWGRPIEPHVEALRLIPTMPLDRVLFMSHDLLHGTDDMAALRTGLTYAQSWAFVHFLIFGQRNVPKTALTDYVKLLRTTHPDAAFQQAFAGSYAEVGRKLHDYLRNGRYLVATQDIRPLPALAAEAAGTLEVEEAMARLRIAGRRHGEARESIERVIAAAPEQPRGYELKAELAAETGDAAGAREAFRAAVERESTDFRAHFEVATADMRNGLESDGSLRNLTPEQARQIANRLERAINLNPRYLPAYQSLAGLVELLPANSQEDEKFLQYGLKVFPSDGMLRLGLAALEKRRGNVQRAKDLVAQVLDGQTPHPPHVTAYARRLESAWLRSDVFGRVNALSKERKYAEAIEVIDAQLKEGADLATRQTLQRQREGLAVSVLVQEANTAARERRYEEARAKYQEVLVSNASPTLKVQVQRSLEQMENRAKTKVKNRP